MKCAHSLSAILCLALVGFAGSVSAAEFNEPADTVQEPGPADAVAPTGTTGDSLTAINGSIAESISNGKKDADLYLIFISDPAAFSATTVGGADFDTQLFLFSADGTGIYSNDDTSETPGPGPGKGNNDVLQSTLPAGHILGPTEAGCYLLGISGFNQDPDDGSGPIFPNAMGPGPFTDVVGPKDNAHSLEGWIGAHGNNNWGAYTILLTGVTIEPCEEEPPPPPPPPPPIEVIPEPATMALLGLGLGLAALRLRIEEVVS